MNTKDFQQTLVSSINKLSVNGGNAVTNNVDYPASDMLKSGEHQMYKIVDQAGNAVGNIGMAVFTLGEKTVNTGIAVGKGAINAAKNTLNTGAEISREALLGLSDVGTETLSGLESIGKSGLNTVYNGVSDVGSGLYNVGTTIGKSGFDTASKSVSGLNNITNKSTSGARNLVASASDGAKSVSHTVGDRTLKSTGRVSEHLNHIGNAVIDTSSNLVNNVSSTTFGAIHDVTNTTANVVNDVSNTTVNVSKKVVNSGIDGVHTLVHGITKIGEHSFNTVVDLTRDVVDGALEVGNSVLNTGLNMGNSAINTTKDVSMDGLHTGVDIVNNLGRDAYSVGESGLEMGSKLSRNVINGVTSIGNTGINSGTNLLNVGQSRLNNSGKNISSGVNQVMGNISNTGKDVEHVILKGGNQTELLHTAIRGDSSVSGVSVLNLGGDSSRMLIPTNFLTSKHVYFVRYQPEGTNLYDYKLQMKGGKVHFLHSVNVNSVWKTNKFSDSMPDSVLISGKEVLNNLITDLKTTQFGGMVEQRVMDKDQYYNDYKNYKLRYLALKN